MKVIIKIFVFYTLLFGSNVIAASKDLNPTISLILSGSYNSFSNNPDNYQLPGFSLAEETGPGEEGFTLSETELLMTANIDDRFYGSATFAISSENEIELEEAYVETTLVDTNVHLKFGRFFSHAGYMNKQHRHRWDFSDAPLVYRAMLGNQFNDDGLQIRYTPATEQYFEFGVEASRGNDYPAGGSADDGNGAYTYFIKTGGDFNASHSWQLGAAYLDLKSDNRQTNDLADSFTGDTEIYVLDFVWQWAPDGNREYKNFTFQSEFIWRDEMGVFNGSNLDSSQFGYYLQAVYQWQPDWQIGLRYDFLEADDPGAAFTATSIDPQGHSPERYSVMLNYKHSEYSQIQFQYNIDDSQSDNDDQFYIKYTMSMGTHSAHNGHSDH